MKELWELCRKLHNPRRLELLRRIYTSYHNGGLGVNEATDTGILGQSASSLYLKHLEELGLVRRERGGRFVGYYSDWSRASSSIGEIAAMFHERFNAERGKAQLSLLVPLGVLGNAFRLRAVHRIYVSQRLSKERLADYYGKEVRIITRDLDPAVKAGLISVDSDDDDGVYEPVQQRDAIIKRIIELGA